MYGIRFYVTCPYCKKRDTRYAMTVGQDNIEVKLVYWCNGGRKLCDKRVGVIYKFVEGKIAVVANFDPSKLFNRQEATDIEDEPLTELE